MSSPDPEPPIRLHDFDALLSRRPVLPVPMPFSSFGSFKQRNGDLLSNDSVVDPHRRLFTSVEAPAILESSPHFSLQQISANYSPADLQRELAWERKTKLHEEKRKRRQEEEEDGEEVRLVEATSIYKEGECMSSDYDEFVDDGEDAYELESSTSSQTSSSSSDEDAFSSTTDGTTLDKKQWISDDGVYGMSRIRSRINLKDDELSPRRENMNSEQLSVAEMSSLDDRGIRSMLDSNEDECSAILNLDEKSSPLISDEQREANDESDIAGLSSDSNHIRKMMLNRMKSSSFTKGRHVHGRRPRMNRTKTRTWTFTDEDMEELRGSIDLGFGFSGEESYDELKETLPALGLYRAINQQSKCSPHAYSHSTSGPSSPVSSASVFSTTSSPLPDSTYPRFSSPGDRPKDVKQRLRKWAKIVALSIKEGFAA